MFEVAGTHFERGIFELRLKKHMPRPLGFICRLGPIRGRFLALAFLGVAGLLTFKQQPMRWLMDNGWVNNLAQAQQTQLIVTYAIAGFGTLVYLLVFFFRQERLDLSFDRHERSLRFRHIPLNAKFPTREGLSDFSSIESMEVFGPERSPKTPNGFMELKLKNQTGPYRAMRFKFLSDDQLKIYPSNLSKLTGIQPKGDWADPDDELVKSP